MEIRSVRGTQKQRVKGIWEIILGKRRLEYYIMQKGKGRNEIT